MTHIEQAIKEAVEKGGYGIHIRPYTGPLVINAANFEPDTWERIWKYIIVENKCEERIFLDPSFWQALGKARGWIFRKTHTFKEHLKDEPNPRCVSCNWHRFIDHLAEGKDAESFFASLY